MPDMTREILPGFSVIEVPLPRSPLKSVNSYVITGSDRNLVIDTGTVLETPRASVKTIAYPQGPSCL